jgi:hypothetical protein
MEQLRLMPRQDKPLASEVQDRLAALSEVSPRRFDGGAPRFELKVRPGMAALQSPTVFRQQAANLM